MNNYMKPIVASLKQWVKDYIHNNPSEDEAVDLLDYMRYQSGNDFRTAGTYNFTCRLMRNIIQSSTTFKRYYLDVDDSGTLRAIEV